MGKLHFLITAGGTREYIDPVRYISNASTGKMGYALAVAAIDAGHEVTLISAPTFLESPQGARLIEVETSRQMLDAVQDEFEKCDCLIMAAAVSDYRPVRTSDTKIKKSKADMTIELEPTTDILAWAGQAKSQQKVVGFALEDRDLRQNAEKKLLNKNLDMIIANSPDAIASNKSSVQIKQPGKDWVELEYAVKIDTARKIMDFAVRLF